MLIGVTLAGVLFTSKLIPAFDIPYWVLMVSYTAIAIGTLSGGWRIVRTMGARLTRLKPRSGFCAETGAAGSGPDCNALRAAGLNNARDCRGDCGGRKHQPVEGCALGNRYEYVGAWVLTIPMAGIIAWFAFWAMRVAGAS